ncbi:hypothetical protein HQ29_08720 [Porphyromonas canoris]|nr:hypothetical protein HQ29_08720 [Porphyromonas canoris]
MGIEKNFHGHRKKFPCAQKNIYVRTEKKFTCAQKNIYVRTEKNFCIYEKKFLHMQKKFFAYAEIYPRAHRKKVS